MARDLEKYIDRVAEGIVLPELGEKGLGQLRQQDAVAMALPPVTNAGTDPFVGFSTKARDAALYADQQRIAYAQTRAQLKRNAEVSKAEERAIDRAFKRASTRNKKVLGNVSRAYVRGRNRSAQRMAGEGLGMGPDLFKVLG